MMAVLLLLINSNYSRAQCNLNAGFSYTQGVNGQIVFSSTSTGTLPSTTYYWTFGDNGSGTGVTVSHTYVSNGNYNVFLYVSNSSSVICTDSIAISINVTSSSCNLNSNFSYMQGANGLVSFTSTSIGTSSNSTYFWNFGDVSVNSNGLATSHTYSANGTYYVLLGVTNSFTPSLCSDTIIIPITINSFSTSCNLNANFNYTIGTGGIVNFASLSTGTNSGTNYQWHFYPGLNFGATTTHTFSNGTYTVTLFLSDSLCSDSITKTIVVGGSSCNLNANFNYTVGAGGLVNFASTSTGTTSGTNYQWHFYPGLAFGATTTHTFSNGSYNVTLFLSDSLCSDSVTKTIVVGGCNLNANFTHTVGAGGLVNFSSTSTGTASGTTYSWNFGNVYFGTGATPSQVFNNGTYTVVLTVVSNSICVDSVMQVINVTTGPLGLAKSSLTTIDCVVYPNPNNGQFELKINPVEGEAIKVTIYNLVGELVYEEQLLSDRLITKINLEQVSSGVYFMKLNYNNYETTKKIIINK